MPVVKVISTNPEVPTRELCRGRLKREGNGTYFAHPSAAKQAVKNYRYNNPTDTDLAFLMVSTDNREFI